MLHDEPKALDPRSQQVFASRGLIKWRFLGYRGAKTVLRRLADVPGPGTRCVIICREGGAVEQDYGSKQNTSNRSGSHLLLQRHK